MSASANSNAAAAEAQEGAVAAVADAETSAVLPSSAEEAGAADAAEANAPAGGEDGVGGPASPPEGQKATAPAEEPTAPKRDWKDDRIRVLTAKLREAQGARQDGASDEPRLDENEVNRRAEALAAQNDFNRRCNEVAESGRKAFGDFDSKIEQLRSLVTPGDAGEAAAYARLVEATLETGESARLLYELGNAPEQAIKLMGMSPVRMGIELAKLAGKKGEPEPSGASKPINPVGARGRANEEIDPADPRRGDNLSTKAWIERRQRDVDARRKAGERIW